MRTGLFTASLIAMVGSGIAVAGEMPAANRAQAHRDQALKIAGAEFYAYARARCYPKEPRQIALKGPIPATRVFDNLIFVGNDPRQWNGWVLETSEGLIVFDPLVSDEEAERDIVQGLKSLGVDPMRIKHIVVMHGHGDHYGGAPYLADLTGAQIHMSALDWEMIQQPRPRTLAKRKPERVHILNDGDSLTLGDTQVRFFVTRTHTEGTLAALLPVQNGQQRHQALYWGGTGMQIEALLGDYARETQRIGAIAADAGADVFISNHPSNDISNLRLPQLAPDTAGADHPFVVGKQGVSRLLGVLRECALAAQTDAIAKVR